MLVKLTNTGAISWQKDLVGVYSANISDIRQLSNGSFVAVGVVVPESSTTGATDGLLVKLSSTGSLQWVREFSKDSSSFTGAYTGGYLSFESAGPAASRYGISGTAEAHFTATAASGAATRRGVPAT
jgi:hypothetical protein